MSESASKYQRYHEYIDTPGASGSAKESGRFAANHLYQVAPIFTGQVLSTIEDLEDDEILATRLLPQYALIGVQSDGQYRNTTKKEVDDNLVFGNANEPWSAFICGSQGSGKSHTLSCLLENALLSNSPVGVVPISSAGMVFHYDTFSTITQGQVCEAAYLCSSGVKVTVLVAPNSLDRMKEQYRKLPGLPRGTTKPKVVPLYFKQAQLTIDTIMTLMAVQDTGIGAPLYINSIRQLLRDMDFEQQGNLKSGFDYDEFTRRLAGMQLTDGAMAPLELRLQLLRSVLLAPVQEAETRTTYEEIWNPASGTLTIIDLSDAFINASDACALFSICLSQFVAGWRQGPRIVALDEAHKFLKATAEAQKLTEDLIGIVREQRHRNSRVIVATQEPTVSGEFLDLCNVNIVHRFASPKWYDTLKHHIAAAHRDARQGDSLFKKIVDLNPGEAYVFCPTAVLRSDEDAAKPMLLGDGAMKLRIRQRVSADGGKSVLPSHTTVTSDSEDDGDEEYDNLKVTRFANVSLKEIATRAKGQANNVAAPFVFRSGMQSSGLAKHSAHSVTSDADDESEITGLGSNLRNALQLADVPKKQTSSSHTQETKKQKKSQPPKDPIAITSHGKQIPESQMQKAVRKQIRTFIAPSQIRDPSGHFADITKAVEKDLSLPKNALKSAKIQDGGQEIKFVDFLKKHVKLYYDEQGIPNKKRAPNPWLLKS